MFNLKEVDDVLWSEVALFEVPEYLHENIARILAVTSEGQSSNEAFSRTILDQIIVSAMYEENGPRLRQPSSSSLENQAIPEPQAGVFQQWSTSSEDAAVLELQHETFLQRPVAFKGERRLLSGYADCTVWYDAQRKQDLSTNLIIIEAKKRDHTDTCLGQLTACMGIIHASRKEKKKENSTIYGVASDGLSFRFCRIDNNGHWCKSNLLDWNRRCATNIFSIFRSLIRIAALSSPSTSPVKNPQQRAKILASFGSPRRRQKFDFDLSRLELLEEDDETIIVSLRSLDKDHCDRAL